MRTAEEQQHHDDVMELRRLIKEQRADDDFTQTPEAMTVPYGLVLDVRDEYGRMVVNLPRGSEPECAIHGSADIAVDATRGYRCRPCDRERKRVARFDPIKVEKLRASNRASKARARAR